MSDDGILIAEMARQSGLSIDTLRWYEKEGMLPRVGRGPDGRRRYGEGDRTLVRLLVTLRATGMTTGAMKEFVELLAEGADSHGRRVALLAQTRADLEARRRAVDDALDALDAKVAHYEQLIEAGLDCDGSPVPVERRAAQRRTHRSASRSEQRVHAGGCAGVHSST